MPSAKYEPLTVSRNLLATGSGTDKSSRSAPWTLDSDSEEDAADLERLEEEDAVELKELNREGKTTGISSGRANTGTLEELEEDLLSSGDDGETKLEDYEHQAIRRSSVASFELYTPDEERRVQRKLDTRLVIFVALLYMMSFLDRSNIGNAKVAGLMQDLDLTDDQFGWLLSAFYITYILFEWMTLCYRIFPPHIYITCCVCAWGVLASLQALATSFPYMVILRVFLGIGEAAFVGIPIYLSFFFRREELALRVGLFISAAPLAEAFASSLAYAIVSLGDKTGISSWRLLFLVEGFPACIVAVWAWWWLPDGPATARWLTTRERKVASLRMRNETKASDGAKVAGASSNIPRHRRKFQWQEVTRTLKDPKSYLTAGMFFCCNIAFSSMPVFLPSIINAMGYNKLQSQGLSAPPFLFAFVVVLLTAFLSDRYGSRSIPMMLHATLALSGYVFAIFAGTFRLGHTLRYLAVYPICAGFFSAVTVVITWTINNQASDEGKGTGMAVLNIFGQMGPLLGTRLYPDSDRPYYIKGNVMCAVAMAIAVVLAIALRVVLTRENARRRARWKNAEGEALVGESQERTFMYMI